MTTWMMDTQVFEGLVNIVNIALVLSVIGYLAEIVVNVLVLGWSKKITYFWIAGIIMIIGGWLLINWGIAIYTYSIVTPIEGVDVTKAVIEPAFFAFLAPIVIGIAICVAVALLILKRWKELD